MESISIAALSGLASLITVLFPAFALIAIAFRTRFSHTFLMYRLWQFVFNPREIEDSVVKQHIEEETVVATFRTRYNIRIDLPAQGHKLIHWAKTRDLPMPAIGACGYYFDLKLCEIRKTLPSQRRMNALAVFAMVLGGCALMLLAVGMNSSVLAQLKESERYFWVNGDVATPLFPQGPALTRSSCNNIASTQATPESFSIADREIICKALTDENELGATGTFLKKGLVAQRVFLAILFAVMLVPFTISVWTVQELRAAYRLKKALEEKPDQSTTDRPQSNPPASSLEQEPSLQTG